MLVDTHAHLNIMVKKKFDVPLKKSDFPLAADIIKQARAFGVTKFVNVGTSLIESQNCISLAQTFDSVFAVVGIHPNDCSESWYDDFKHITKMVENKTKNKIVGIGECGLDKHYPGYNLERQKNAFRAQIELALEYELPIVIHTRDALDETQTILQEYKNEPIKGVIHCFSGNKAFAQFSIDLGFVLGIGGPLTYPKNETLRSVFSTVDLTSIVLETDAPFLPPQIIRGKRNHPKYIREIAQYLADLRGISFEEVTEQTTKNAEKLFKI